MRANTTGIPASLGVSAFSAASKISTTLSFRPPFASIASISGATINKCICETGGKDGRMDGDVENARRVKIVLTVH